MARKSKNDFNVNEASTMTSAEIKSYLEDREARFAEEYLKDLNGTQAAIRAGYKPGVNNSSAAVQASRLLRDERIKAYRSALIRESVENMDVSRDSVVLGLLEIYRRCMSAVPVLEWNSEQKEWVNSGEWKFDAKGAARALEQLSKLLGLEAPVKHEHDFGDEGIEVLFRKYGGDKVY